MTIRSMKSGDWVVVIGAIVLVGWLYARFGSSPEAGRQARLLIGASAVQLIDLSQSRRFIVRGKLGATELEVKEGRIRFERAPCRDKVCVHAGWLQRAGEVAACVPNQVAVEVIAGEPRFDAVSF